VAADGSVRWVLDRRRVSRLEDGRLRVCGSLTDVTERRRMEEALLHNSGGAQQRTPADRTATEAAQRSRHLHVVRDADTLGPSPQP
jgi:hypothetical protein